MIIHVQDHTEETSNLKRSYLQWSSGKGWGPGSLLKRTRAEGCTGRSEAGHLRLVVALRVLMFRYSTDLLRVPCGDVCLP